MKSKRPTIRERIAILIAQGEQTQRDIAKEVGVREETISRWLNRSDFTALIDAEKARVQAALRAEGIANKQNRIDAYNDRWNRMQRVIAERADDPIYADVAGGSTGLLVRQIKQVGAGSSAQIIEEYAVDTGLLSEMRQTEKQAAQEVGEWTEKRELTGKDGGPVAISDATERSAAVLAAERAYITTLQGQPPALGSGERDDRPADDGAAAV